MTDNQAGLPRAWLSFGREMCGDLTAGLRREWLVTNGLGGYASASLAGPLTRRYHGLLVAALAPPVERIVLVGGSIDWATYDGKRYPLSTHEYGDGTVDPQGYRHLESFGLEGSLPVWTFALADALLEKRVWMGHQTNTTYVRYRLVRASQPVTLEITPLVTYRDYHSLRRGDGWQPSVQALPDGIEVRAGSDPHLFRLLAPGARFEPGGTWYWNFWHRRETERGLDDRSDLYAVGTFCKSLALGESLGLTLSTEAEPDLNVDQSLEAELHRQGTLLERAGAVEAEPLVQQLTLAADQFLVRRGQGRTVIAGYHWFTDWGRDTMISLPGLTLATGRAEEAADILRTFAGLVDQGLLPNTFPDRAGGDPAYNTVDGTLWYVLAVRAYDRATHDERLASEVRPVLRRIVDWHVRGTRYGIGVDPTDGLLRAGAPGYQLTWMDAKVGDWVVTPRIGKPVEINALWYNALRSLAELDTASDSYASLAEHVQASFRARFVRSDRTSLADVVDGPDGDDWSVRPNQIFAVSLPYPLLTGEQAAGVVDCVGRALLTSYGLRSLSPDEPAYRGDYAGDQVRRDGAYHQGPVWPWLIGAFVEAHYRVHADTQAALSFLRPFVHHIGDAGIGSISEIMEGDAPHLPRGCVAQAWSVAEVLRVYRALSA